MQRTRRFGQAPKELIDRWLGFNPARDVITPAHNVQNVPAHRSDFVWQRLKSDGQMRKFVARKQTLAFFVGSFYWDNDPQHTLYSLGWRQKILHTVLNNVTNSSGWTTQSGQKVLLTKKLPDGIDFVQAMRRSRFCPCPAGWGFAVRLMTSAMHGCIPVLFDDGITQPFHDVLPYQDFSVRLSWSDIPNMVNILEAIPPRQVLHLYEGLARHYRAFVWPQEVGGKAYHRTLDSLFKRAAKIQARP
mmetsp:Transcript_26370/g.78297  ORF Transcript_26370/g.78297 Transcript_26370/m.78297 type:complete len:245 (-) Transcript_26370:211-945(-)